HQDIDRLYGKAVTNEQQQLREEKYFRTNAFKKNEVRHPSEREKWHHDLAFGYELGTVYTLMAGLLNILAICDARWGPFVPPPPKAKDAKPDDST
ncbi:MAG: DUF6677 family protein, partial [Bythopirellula sp.]